jgi:hypothetical protein
MKGWESPFIFSYQQHGTMFEEQRVSDINPLYTLANVTRFPVQFPSYLHTGSYTHRVSDNLNTVLTSLVTISLTDHNLY